MRGLWRSLALAAAMHVVAAAGVATAQTVVVTGAAPRSTVELLLNSAKTGTATADATGNATLPVSLSKPASKTATDVRVWVDTCEALRRVMLVEPLQEVPALGAGCVRKEFTELFVLRQATTLVVDVATGHEAVWVIQGRPPADWLRPDREAVPPPERRPSPKGIVLFGGASYVKYNDAVAVACGSASECSGTSSRLALSVGAGYWVIRYLGIEAAYVRPQNVTASGSGNGYAFNSSLDTNIFTLVGKGGYAYGPFRFYGQAGANYSRTLATTAETFTDYTYTIDNVTQTIAGGSQTLQMRTGGWGWLFGGGAEIWIKPRFAIYGEVWRAALKGSNLDAAEGSIDDRLTFIMGGVRVHLGR